MLGVTQRQALFDWLTSSTAAFKIIVSSVPFHAWAAKDDAWNGTSTGTGAFQTELDTVFDFIRSSQIADVVLISGDMHWSGVFAHGAGSGQQVIWEFMSSPIASKLATARVPDGPEFLYASGQQLAFGLFHVDTRFERATLRYELHNASGSLYEITLASEYDRVPTAPWLTAVALGGIGAWAIRRSRTIS